MMNMVPHIIVSAVVLAGVIVMIRFLMRTGLMCQFCGATDVKVWDRLSDRQQRAILEYFMSHERREPDTSGVFVCDACRTVFDDFSGEKANREVDSVVVGAGTRVKGLVTCKAWCKVCNSMLLSCDPDNEDIRCRTCGTRYEWRTHEASGYRFLMPPKDAGILERCSDPFGVA
jgi:hypothetical protein